MSMLGSVMIPSKSVVQFGTLCRWASSTSLASPRVAESAFPAYGRAFEHCPARPLLTDDQAAAPARVNCSRHASGPRSR